MATDPPPEPLGAGRLAALFREHGAGLAGLVRGVLGAAADPAEGIQDAWLQAFAALGRGARPERPVPWIQVRVDGGTVAERAFAAGPREPVEIDLAPHLGPGTNDVTLHLHGGGAGMPWAAEIAWHRERPADDAEAAVGITTSLERRRPGRGGPVPGRVHRPRARDDHRPGLPGMALRHPRAPALGGPAARPDRPPHPMMPGSGGRPVDGAAVGRFLEVLPSSSPGKPEP